MKIYVKVVGGLVTGIYTDDKETNIDIVMCDQDNADQEIENDGFDFGATQSCKELENNANKLRVLY